MPDLGHGPMLHLLVMMSSVHDMSPSQVFICNFGRRHFCFLPLKMVADEKDMSEYEKMRHVNIQRNNALLESLDIHAAVLPIAD